MSTKDQESKQSSETEIKNTPLASSDANPEGRAGEPSPEKQQSADIETESSSEDLLDDVRRSLIEEETDKDSKDKKWWRRFGRKRKSSEPEPSPSSVEIDLPAAMLQADVVEDQNQAPKLDEYEEQIKDLIDLLEPEVHEASVETSSVAANVEALPEPQPEIDFEQLKEQAFRPRSPQAAESENDVRSIALEGGEEVFVEVESRPADTLKERVSAFENALKPYRSYIYLTLGFLGIVLAGILSLLLFNAYQQSRPEPVREVSNLPYPVIVSLPGGWSFNLGKGTLQEGRWEPNGAEWLEGTEICRWVSLPWSRQLEAVLRTLNQNDPIELIMSNNDKLTYGVYSVNEMALEEIQALDSNSPCLLLILTGADSEKRWVLTAKP